MEAHFTELIKTIYWTLAYGSELIRPGNSGSPRLILPWKRNANDLF
jgi:hypothetical protein